MNLILVLAAAASLSAPMPKTGIVPIPSLSATPGLVDVSHFDDRAMVRAVAPAPCASGDFAKRPQTGCLRHAEHEAPRK